MAAITPGPIHGSNALFWPLPSVLTPSLPLNRPLPRIIDAVGSVMAFVSPASRLLKFLGLKSEAEKWAAPRTPSTLFRRPYTPSGGPWARSRCGSTAVMAASVVCTALLGGLLTLKMRGGRHSSLAFRSMAEPPTRALLERHDACVLEGGFYEGIWAYRPNSSRPEALYMMGNHSFSARERKFRAEFPVDKVCLIPHTHLSRPCSHIHVTGDACHIPCPCPPSGC